MLLRHGNHPTDHPPTHMCAKKGKTMKSEGAEGAKGCDGCHHCYVNVTTFWLPPRWCVSVSCFMHNFCPPPLLRLFLAHPLCACFFIFLNVCRWWNVAKDNCLTISRRVESTTPLMPGHLPARAVCASSISLLCYFNFMLLLWHNENKIELTLMSLLPFPSLGSW